MAYSHGVNVSEVPTSILPPVRVSAGLPVVFGTAPVNMTDTPAATLNKPVLVYTYAEAVQQLGFVPANASGDYDYSISEFMRSHFALFNVAPVVFVNVLDPATHVGSETDEAVTLMRDRATLANTGIMLDSVIVKNQAGDTTYDVDDDYVLTFDNDAKVVINRLSTGTMTEDEALTVDYDYLDPTLVDSADIIGGVDVNTGALSGLELINEVFPRFSLVPGQLLAPGFSTDPSVAAVMDAKASNINGHFKAVALTDIPTDEVTNYTDAPAWKNDNNVVSEFQAACWPMVSFGGVRYHLSTQLAGVICKTDSNNSDIPYVSPSNQNLQMDSAVLSDGSEVFIGPGQGAFLNGEGVITALNFVGGWKAWGNRTAIYPASTDPKDSFLALRRMFNWVGNTLTLTFWQRLDAPLNRRQIQTVTDSANVWLNGLTAQGYLLGGRVEFLQDENPTTDLMDGIARFHVYLTPPSPNRQIDFILEYDPAYLQALFA